MTDAQRDELKWLRMKAASPEMVTVPRALLGRVLLEAEANSVGFANVTAEVSRISAKAPAFVFAFAKWKRRNWRE